ncbi:MAG: hypothetical protein JST00_32895 [Deltaproteobacteria bacterium]|nr:hypothetical protein [Deltaproteobacteria bacterium]
MRWSSVRSLVVMVAIGSLAACSAPTEAEGTNGDTTDENEIVNVAQTDVERQSIGNCWLYAHASWVESMHKTATGEDFDVSQSYWTYWHWFDQIAGGFTSEVSTGGGWAVANEIVKKYGLMAEKDFIAADSDNEMSSRQASALSAINASLKTGVLADPAKRRDKKALRAEMDRAWGLTPDVASKLTQAFGESATRTFASRTPARSEGTNIIRPQDFKVSYASGPGRAPISKSLSDAAREWRQSYYSRGDRAFLTRVQKALHAAQPVIVSWFVDFNAMENREGPLRGSFNMKTLNELGPGRQGGHMTVFEDYSAKLPDGTVLPAGETLAADDPKLQRALDPRTEILFFRVKNSWGAARPDRAFAPGMPGYHDLQMGYLDGPVKKCAERNGQTDTTNCTSEQTPLKYVILPPGF